MGLPKPSRETKFSGTNGDDRGIVIFPVQLTTSRMGDLTRLTHDFAICVTIYTYVHKHTHTHIHTQTHGARPGTDVLMPLTEVSRVPPLPSCNGPQPLTWTKVTPSVSCYHSILGVCTTAAVLELWHMRCSLCLSFFLFLFSEKHRRCCCSVMVLQCTTTAVNTLV